MRRCVDWIETTKSSEVCFWMTYEMEVFVTVCHCCTVAGGVNGWGHAEVHHHAFRHWLRHLGSRRGFSRVPSRILAWKQMTSMQSHHFSPTAECYGVFAQSRFRCVLGEMGRFRERTGFREPVPGTEGGSIRWLPTGSGVPKVVSNRFRFGKWLRFRRFWIWWFLMGSDGFEGWEQVVTTLGLAQCVWQCCAESECICVKRDC